MEGYMHFCKNWGSEECHPDVRKHRDAKELKSGEEIPLWPVGKEQERLEEICKKCETGEFDIEEKKCPFCDDKNIQFFSEDKTNAQPIYNYKCIKCGRKMFSYKKFH